MVQLSKRSGKWHKITQAYQESTLSCHRGGCKTGRRSLGWCELSCRLWKVSYLKPQWITSPRHLGTRTKRAVHLSQENKFGSWSRLPFIQYSGTEVTYSQLLPSIGLNVSEEMISAWMKIDKKRSYGADCKERPEIKERRKKHKRQGPRKPTLLFITKECNISHRGFMQMSLLKKREKNCKRKHKK